MLIINQLKNFRQMKYRLSKYVYFLLSLLLFDSCQSIMCSIYGIQTKPVSKKNIAKKEKKYHINQDDIYKIDSSFFIFLDSLGKTTTDSSICNIIKNHYQPLQVMVFDFTGKLCSYHTNCYAEAFPNLKWRGFNTFPPITSTPIDTIITLNILEKYIFHLQEFIERSNKEYTVIVFWTAYMGRQSKRLIALMQQKIPKNKVNLIYVNIEDVLMLP